MHNCIFTAHCIETTCDMSCPLLVETSYLLERNGIAMNNPVFYDNAIDYDKILSVLSNAQGKIATYIATNGWNTNQCADILTYAAICQNWKGNQLHCSVYNLKYAKYLDEIKKSWSTKTEPESLEYMRIWSETAKVLIISNLDYVNFGDFESQTLLNLFQTRSNPDFTTIVVSPPIKQLVSAKFSMFFNSLKNVLSAGVKVITC